MQRLPLFLLWTWLAIAASHSEGRVTIHDYDNADRLVGVTNPENETTTYTWDANGNHTGQTDARGRTTTFEYDELDHLVARVYPDTTMETYTHDAHGNRLSHTDADGQTRTYTYDGLDRRVTASYPDATGSQAETVEYTYDGNGNRTEVTETLAAGGTETSTYSYDAFDRLERETDRYGRSTAHLYDLKGNRTRRIDETGTTIYGIDALDRTETITAPGRGAVEYTYSDAGLVTQIDHPDGTRTEQTYDPAGRIATVEHYNGGEREAYYEYAYDDNGNRISQVEDLGSGETETTYTYDDADRLIETERADRTTEYVLDDVGNRIEERITDPGGTTVKTFDYNDRDQLERIYVDGALETEYTYDANGNRIQATTGGIIRHFNFSARDRLVSLNVQGSPPEVQWEYDDAGFRISETTPSEARRFRWDNETLSYETNVLGNILARYDHGPDRLLAETEGSTTRTWLTDALQTPVKRLNQDGSTYSFTRYDEYGEVEEENSPDIPRFGFTGHQRGPAEAPDLYYAQQRWYNAATGRFISEDPVWGEPDTPPSLHRYLYAYANPTVFWDLDGQQSIEINLPSCDESGSCSSSAVSGNMLHFIQPNQMASSEQADALREAQLRSILFNSGNSDSTMVAQPLLATGAGQFDEPYIVHGSSRSHSNLQRQANINRRLGIESGYIPYARGIEAAGADLVYGIPPVAVAHGVARIVNAEGGGDIALGAAEIGLAAAPVPFMVHSELGSMRSQARRAASEVPLLSHQPINPRQLPVPMGQARPGIGAPVERTIVEGASGVQTVSNVIKGADNTVDVYRAFGGDARAQGFSWTTIDPRTVSNFRDVAGLPSGGASGAINTADFLIKGKANVADIIKSRSAFPLDGNKGVFRSL